MALVVGPEQLPTLMGTDSMLGLYLMPFQLRGGVPSALNWLGHRDAATMYCPQTE